MLVRIVWDSDTFSEEALRQKDVAEIVRGRLGKHSDLRLLTPP